MRTGQFGACCITTVSLLLLTCHDTVRVPDSDDTPPSAVLIASGLRGDVVTVEPDQPDAERRIDGTETIELLARATDRDGGIQRVTLSGVIHVFCTDNASNEPVTADHTVHEEDAGTAGVGDDAPKSRGVSYSISPEDLPPLCPSGSAFGRSEGEFTALGENVHGAVVETARFVYVEP